MSQSNANVHTPEFPAGRAAKLPQYMFKPGGTLYFRRKIPTDAADAFPGFKEQVSRSLETNLLSKAKVRLAVAVTEFNLTLAAFRRQRATQQAAHESESGPPGPDLMVVQGERVAGRPSSRELRRFTPA
jgi:hypothetical protein